MTGNQSLPINLLEYIHGFVVASDCNELTEDRWANFEQLLRNDDDACQLYVEYMDVAILVPYILDTMPDEEPASAGVFSAERPRTAGFLSHRDLRHARLFLRGHAAGVSAGDRDNRTGAVDRLCGPCGWTGRSGSTIGFSPFSPLPSLLSWAGSPAWSTASGLVLVLVLGVFRWEGSMSWLRV